ncbi:hypothetical protein DENSPDRAFT_902292 [Dentipellis sp. KUC8613]|nr:hypothetical protein DENSPDRAFT_902292 [Dentipellis sp. KUC8613]
MGWVGLGWCFLPPAYRKVFYPSPVTNFDPDILRGKLMIHTRTKIQTTMPEAHSEKTKPPARHRHSRKKAIDLDFLTPTARQDRDKQTQTSTGAGASSARGITPAETRKKAHIHQRNSSPHAADPALPANPPASSMTSPDVPRPRQTATFIHLGPPKLERGPTRRDTMQRDTGGGRLGLVLRVCTCAGRVPCSAGGTWDLGLRRGIFGRGGLGPSLVWHKVRELGGVQEKKTASTRRGGYTALQSFDGAHAIWLNMIGPFTTFQRPSSHSHFAVLHPRQATTIVHPAFQNLSVEHVCVIITTQSGPQRCLCTTPDARCTSIDSLAGGCKNQERALCSTTGTCGPLSLSVGKNRRPCRRHPRGSFELNWVLEFVLVCFYLHFARPGGGSGSNTGDDNDVMHGSTSSNIRMPYLCIVVPNWVGWAAGEAIPARIPGFWHRYLLQVYAVARPKYPAIALLLHRTALHPHEASHPTFNGELAKLALYLVTQTENSTPTDVERRARKAGRLHLSRSTSDEAHQAAAEEYAPAADHYHCWGVRARRRVIHADDGAYGTRQRDRPRKEYRGVRGTGTLHAARRGPLRGKRGR